jgi:hypothetical protein
MQLHQLEVCSFCGRSGVLGFSSPDAATQVCQRCAFDMQSAISHVENPERGAHCLNQSNLFEEWMLLLFPITIILIAVVLEQDTIMTPLLEIFGVMFVTAALFSRSWGRIVQKNLKPGYLVLFAWIACGAALGYPAGSNGLLVGAGIGMATWVGCRSVAKRMKIARFLNVGVSSNRPN